MNEIFEKDILNLGFEIRYTSPVIKVELEIDGGKQGKIPHECTVKDNQVMALIKGENQGEYIAWFKCFFEDNSTRSFPLEYKVKTKPQTIEQDFKIILPQAEDNTKKETIIIKEEPKNVAQDVVAANLDQVKKVDSFLTKITMPFTEGKISSFPVKDNEKQLPIIGKDADHVFEEINSSTYLAKPEKEYNLVSPLVSNFSTPSFSTTLEFVNNKFLVTIESKKFGATTGSAQMVYEFSDDKSDEATSKYYQLIREGIEGEEQDANMQFVCIEEALRQQNRNIRPLMSQLLKELELKKEEESIEKAIKGSMHREHKYIKREGDPGGYKYTYPGEEVDPQKTAFVIDVFDNKRFALKFDFGWQDARAQQITNEIRNLQIGRFDSNKKVWWIWKNQIHTLFDKLNIFQNIAISKEARYDLDAGQNKAQNKQTETATGISPEMKDFNLDIRKLNYIEVGQLINKKVINDWEKSFILNVKDKLDLSPKQIQKVNDINFRFNDYLNNNLVEKERMYSSFKDKKDIEERGKLKSKIEEGLLEIQELENFKTPEWFKKERLLEKDFYGFQKKGINWLNKVESGILAYDTGLGKTLVSICAAGMSKTKGPALVFAPKNVLFGWKSEIEKYTDKKVLVLSGSKEEKLEAIKGADKYDFIVTTYGMLQDKNKIDYLVRHAKPGIVIADEAHRLAGDTLQADIFEKYFSESKKHFLSATPMPNRPEEVFRLMSMIKPEILGSFYNFRDKYCITEDVWVPEREVWSEELQEKINQPAHQVKKVVGYQNKDVLHKTIKPYLFAKLIDETDVAKHIPKKFYPSRPTIKMDSEQIKMMKAIKNDLMDYLRGVDENKYKGKEKQEVIERLQKMSQVAVSPEILNKKYNKPSPKIAEAISLVNTNMKNHPNKGSIVYCHWLDGVDLMKKYLMQNSKLKESEIGILKGATTSKKMFEASEKFKNGEYKVLVCSDSASEGLNLQWRGNLMVHLDTPWNPKILKQREGRIYRIGQDSQTTYIRDLMDSSVEQYMDQIVRTKKSWIDTVIHGKDIVDEELLDMMSLKEIMNLVEKL